jgi:predicted acylesterase/phospholipase RssA
MEINTNGEQRTQRALVLQGGGSLGAYEAGVFKAIYESLFIQDQKNGEKDRPLFDIVAGTSIGAINAAVLVNHVINNKTWKGSPEKLYAFWDFISTNSFVDTLPGFTDWWDYWHNINPSIAPGEAARRYYSTKQFEMTGVSNVFMPFAPLTDTKFMDVSNTWFRYDKTPLKKSIEQFVKFPIATSYDDGDENQKNPRLLLVSVDVQEGATVTFDSYPKADGSRKTEYGKRNHIVKDNIIKEEGYKHTIFYNDGITSDHVIASASVPINYDYTIIEDVESKLVNTVNYGTTKMDDVKNINNDINPDKNSRRYFWDGGMLSNTPIREVINAHQDYWVNVKGAKNSVPNLDLYIINLHPSKQDYVPQDHDGVQNRESDIRYYDRTDHDIKVSQIMADYINMVKELTKVAIDNGVSNKIIDAFFNSTAQSKHRSGRFRKYRDLIEGQFSIDNIVKIERKNDPYTVSNKIFDFSYNTIEHLRNVGYNDAIYQLNQQYLVNK